MALQHLMIGKLIVTKCAGKWFAVGVISEMNIDAIAGYAFPALRTVHRTFLSSLHVSQKLHVLVFNSHVRNRLAIFCVGNVDMSFQLMVYVANLGMNSNNLRLI